MGERRGGVNEIWFGTMGGSTFCDKEWADEAPLNDRGGESNQRNVPMDQQRLLHKRRPPPPNHQDSYAQKLRHQAAHLKIERGQHDFDDDSPACLKSAPANQ